MEQTKLCPRCGKSIPANKTYCLSCGATVATKCPDCGKILPLNPKVCDGCGHSFV
ncbi:MAG: zinc ribbon domain-containing protein, partial [Clostridia bacterium]|nr:zinc ribbon domain-containing protein [Clostridia bacterium]